MRILFVGGSIGKGEWSWPTHIPWMPHRDKSELDSIPGWHNSHGGASEYLTGRYYHDVDNRCTPAQTLRQSANILTDISVSEYHACVWFATDPTWDFNPQHNSDVRDLIDQIRPRYCDNISDYQALYRDAREILLGEFALHVNRTKIPTMMINTVGYIDARPDIFSHTVESLYQTLTGIDQSMYQGISWYPDRLLKPLSPDYNPDILTDVLELSDAWKEQFYQRPELFWPDGIHANRHAHEKIAEHIQSWLLSF